MSHSHFRTATPALMLALAAASPTFALTNPVTQGSITVKLNLITTISTGANGTPQDLIYAPDGSGRLFVTTRNGNIRIINNGVLNPTNFLTLSSAGVSVFTGGEGGLLGMAFSPSYVTDGKFYTFQTEPFSTVGPAADYSPPEMFPTTSINPSNQTTVREWTVSAGNPNVAQTTSRVLLRINHPQNNHQGGGLRFGPDGNLYVSIGDGGGGNDFNVTATSNTDGHVNSIGNGQSTDSPLGKILRINPNPAAGPGFTVSTNGQYSMPNSNPFNSGAGGALKEIYAYGLRNPYRITFDTATGTLYAADVGQTQREEVDVITNGGNYGWPFREGTRDNSGGAGAGRPLPAGFTSLPPIAEYTHADGIAIIGGELYRGTNIPELQGKFVFGDLAVSIGRLFYADVTTGVINEFKFAPTGLTPPSSLYGVGADANGELYAFFSNGMIMAIVPEPATLGLAIPAASLLLLRRSRPQAVS